MRTAAFFSIVISFLALPALAQEKKDAANCSDHPSFGRVQSYWIESCTAKPSGAYSFDLGNGRSTVEGRYWYIRYQPPTGSKPSTAQVLASAVANVKKAGAELVASDSSKETFKITSGGRETWVEVWADYTGKYILTIVERSATTEVAAASSKTQPRAVDASGGRLPEKKATPTAGRSETLECPATLTVQVSFHVDDMEDASLYTNMAFTTWRGLPFSRAEIEPSNAFRCSYTAPRGVGAAVGEVTSVYLVKVPKNRAFPCHLIPTSPRQAECSP